MRTTTTWTSGVGQELRGVHTAASCTGDRCPIHDPSTEAAAIGVTVWVQTPYGGWMHRRCPHGYDHPDPDHRPTSIRQAVFLAEAIYSTHLVEEHCDGCCRRDGQ